MQSRLSQTDVDPFSLQSLRLVDAQPEEAFDNLTSLAAMILKSPVALVSFVQPELDRQYFKSQLGLPEPWASQCQTPLSHSFCQHVVYQDAPLVVEDAENHALVCDNLAIPDLGVQAYLGAPIRDPWRRPIGALCVIGTVPRKWSASDIQTIERLAACASEAIHLRAELRSAEIIRLEQRDFTYAISHDLKAPTNTLRQIHHELITQLGSSADPETLELLGFIQQTTVRMGDLVEDVLRYTSVIGGDVAYEQVDLSEMVGEILDDLKANISGTGAKVQVMPMPVLTGNKLQFRILLQNLISNALKFHKPGVAPCVTISSSHDQSKRRCNISVCDNGIGIAPDDRARIFRIFQRLHLKTEYAGNGLGLSLCQRIAANHGGRIEVRGAPGEGSEFLFSLPMAGP